MITPQTLRLQSRHIQPPGIPEIDWSNPLTVGLIGCYVPSAFPCKDVWDLVPGGAKLAVSAAVYKIGQKAFGLYANGTQPSGAWATPTSRQTPSAAASVFWYGMPLATPGNGASFAGVTQGNAAFTGSDGWGLTVNQFDQLTARCTVSGTPTSGASVNYTLNSEFSAGGSFAPGKNIRLYFNGKQVDSTALGAGTFSYAGSVVTTGAEIGQQDGTRISNLVTYVEFLWSRDLPSAEHFALAFDPYQFLLWPEDELPVSGSSGWPPNVPPMVDRWERPIPIPY